MPSFSSKVQLSTSAKNSNIVLADVDRIKGAFKIYTTAESMNSQSINYFSDGQIVYVEDSGSLFKATITPADPPNTFEDSISFSAFHLIVVHLLVHRLMEQIHLLSLEK